MAHAISTSVLTTVCVLLGSGCGGGITRLGSETYPPHDGKVCILEGAPPPDQVLTPVADLQVKLNSYGGDRKAKLGLAKYARKVGAHAVVQCEFHNFMGAPRGQGRAVRFADASRPPAQCEWY